jgi:hypothetical protein
MQARKLNLKPQQAHHQNSNKLDQGYPNFFLPLCHIEPPGAPCGLGVRAYLALLKGQPVVLMWPTGLCTGAAMMTFDVQLLFLSK